MFFIIGFPRSGTTLLSLMLDAHSSIATSRETHLVGLMCTYENSKTLKGEILSSVGWPNTGLSEADLDAALNFTPFSRGEAINRIYTQYARKHGKTIWGDKTSINWCNVDLIRKALPLAKFIYCIRSGADAIASLRKTPLGFSNDVADLSGKWAYAIEAMPSGEDVHIVRYEDLVSSAASTVVGVCRFLGVQYEPKMLDYHLTASKRMGELKSVPGTRGMLTEREILSLNPNVLLPVTDLSVGRSEKDFTQGELEIYMHKAGKAATAMGY